MEQNIVIYIGVYHMLALVGSAIISVVYLSWQAAGRLSKVETQLSSFENRLVSLEGRLDGIFSSKSPIAILSKGQAILEAAGLDEYVDSRKKQFVIALQQQDRLILSRTKYDIQEAAFRFFAKHSFGAFEDVLKEVAYRNGISIQIVRRLAAIYFRDRCFSMLSSEA